MKELGIEIAKEWFCLGNLWNNLGQLAGRRVTYKGSKGDWRRLGGK
jgi:hypothetical protein